MSKETILRAFAVRDANNKTVNAYGVGDFSESVPVRGFLKDTNIKNPTIKLDSGGVVYGFECWWCSEDKKEKFVGDRELIIVEPPA